ncbi:MAG TPA: TetR/AcrR family transcriptional regulator [Thermoplasmata archaeon]|jgi:AcrR family transcriptional regulator
MSAQKKAQQDPTTRDRILDAALEAFAEKGFRGATTKGIAGAAKVNEVTLFRHFKSKYALFASTLSERSPFPDIGRSVQLDTEGRIDDLLFRNVKAVLGVLRSNKQTYMVVFGDAWRHPRLRTMIGALLVRKGVEFIASFLRTQMDKGRIRRMDPEVSARALMGMVQSYFITTYILEGRTPEQIEEDRFVRGFVNIFLDGARADAGGRTR